MRHASQASSGHASHLAAHRFAAAPASEDVVEKDSHAGAEIPADRYVIATFPDLKQINYMRTPIGNWNSLVYAGLEFPESLCVDAVRMRMFVADKAVEKVYWYQLQFTYDDKLQVASGQLVAAENFLASALAVDSSGGLFLAGTYLPDPQGEASEGVFQIALVGSDNTEPTRVWPPPSNADAEPLRPSGIAVDPFDVYWVHSPGDGDASPLERVQRTTASNPPSAGGLHVTSMADNVNAARSMLLMPSSILYASGGSIFAVDRRKSAASCAGSGDAPEDLCPNVATVEDATGMAFDGDGTVFVADRGAGTVLALASAALPQHVPPPTQCAEAEGIWGLALLLEKSASAPPFRATSALMACLLAAAASALASE